MSADNDGDSHMASSPESESEQTTTTSISVNPADTQLLSPTDPQRPTSAANTSMPAAVSGTAGANANGKRPLNTISNGLDDEEEEYDKMGKQDFPPKVHQPSGYSWTRAEDAPGNAWESKKATEEANRAWDVMVHRDIMIKGTTTWCVGG
jgi:hypothetical protein